MATTNANEPLQSEFLYEQKTRHLGRSLRKLYLIPLGKCRSGILNKTVAFFSHFRHDVSFIVIPHDATYPELQIQRPKLTELNNCLLCRLKHFHGMYTYVGFEILTAVARKIKPTVL
jgi:hypothetical protein